MQVIYKGYEENFQHPRQTIQNIKSKFYNTEKGKESVLTEMIFIKEEGKEQVSLKFKPVPFERLRRITGYLVGKPERWNDGKWAELQDRVKHLNIATA